MTVSVRNPAAFTREQRERLREVYRIILSWRQAQQAEQLVEPERQPAETPQVVPVVSGRVREEA